jgi:hypothetical protein
MATINGVGSNSSVMNTFIVTANMTVTPSSVSCSPADLTIEFIGDGSVLSASSSPPLSSRYVPLFCWLGPDPHCAVGVNDHTPSFGGEKRSFQELPPS